MTCADFEERIALYVGGDLTADERLAVEDHLRACSACAELARELEEDRTRLASRPPETAEVDFAAMRREIRRKIDRPRWIWKWIAAAAAVLLAVGVASMLRRAPVKQAPIRLVAAQKEVAAVIAAPQPKGPVVRPRVRRASAPEQSASTVQIRLATRDPNVTIILLHETREVLQ
jgi:anti-sigma factor RsiW